MWPVVGPLRSACVCRLWADRPGGSVQWQERIRGVQYMVYAIQIDVLTFFTHQQNQGIEGNTSDFWRKAFNVV